MIVCICQYNTIDMSAGVDTRSSRNLCHFFHAGEYRAIMDDPVLSHVMQQKHGVVLQRGKWPTKVY